MVPLAPLDAVKHSRFIKIFVDSVCADRFHGITRAVTVWGSGDWGGLQILFLFLLHGWRHPNGFQGHPSPIGVAYIAHSAAIQHTTCLDWPPQLFSTFIWHPRLSALPICDFMPPKHTRGIVPPPGFFSLIDNYKLSQPIWDVRATIGS